jgi:hypothetical protein
MTVTKAKKISHKTLYAMKKRIKKSYICKDMGNFTVNETLASQRIPETGDVGIFEVLSIGKHNNIQDDTKRSALIYPGDYVMAAFGNRYATEQFEGYVPLQVMEEYHILGAGGTVGIIHSMHTTFRGAGPTRLKMIGFAVSNTGHVLNTKVAKEGEMKQHTGAMQSASNIILSVGSSMDSGKTTTAAHLVRGLKNSGKRTGFIKLTGTVFTKDCDLVYDNGADIVTDFGEMGFPSTYMCSEAELLNLHETLLTTIGAGELDYVVMEIADGLYQRETEMLLTNEKFMSGIHAVVFSACDSLAAVQGVKTLQEMGIVPTALSGVFTASPLLIRETQSKVQVPIFTIDMMAKGECTHLFEERVQSVA